MVNKKSFLLFLILVTAILIYSPSFKNPFIWDDLHLIVNNADIKSFGNLPSVFKTHLFKTTGYSNFYRPMQIVSFMFDYALWKLNPFGYHLTNLFFHLLNVMLIYFLVKRIFKNADIGIIASLIFAVHPINTEAVTYISGRADPLGCFFFLAAFLLYMGFKEQKNKKRLFFLSLLFFALSLLTKEAMLIFPLILILYDALLLREEKVTPKTLKLYAPYFLIIFMYIIWRLFILGFPSQLPSHMPFNLFILNTPKILVIYLWLLLAPFNLHMERIEPITFSAFDPQAMVSLVTLACIVWLSIIIYKRSRQLCFFIVFFFLALLPMLNILTLNAVMAEHWLYLPAIGIYAVVSVGVNKAIEARKGISKLIILVFLCFLSFFSIQTVIRNMEWGDTFEFYKHMIAQSPGSARAHSNIAFFYMSIHDYKSAKREFLKALSLNPTHAFCYQGLGFAEFLEGQKEDAMKHWRTALEIAPLYKPTRDTMNAVLYRDNKRFKNLLRTAVLKPKNITLNYRLSKLYLENGLYIEALYRLDKVLEVDPNYVNAIFNEAWLYSKLGLYKQAIKEYEKVLKLTPDDPQVYENLSYCYSGLHMQKQAGAMQNRASELRKSKP